MLPTIYGWTIPILCYCAEDKECSVWCSRFLERWTLTLEQSSNWLESYKPSLQCIYKTAQNTLVSKKLTISLLTIRWIYILDYAARRLRDGFSIRKRYWSDFYITLHYITLHYITLHYLLLTDEKKLCHDLACYCNPTQNNVSAFFLQHILY